MRSTKVVTTILALALCALGASAATEKRADNWDGLQVATVNGDPITIKDLRAQFKDRHGGHAKFLGGEEELRTFLRVAIDDRLLLQEAYEIALDQEPVVKTASDAFENEKLSDYFVKMEVEKKSEPAEDELRAIWREYGDHYVQIREYGVETREEAEELRRNLVSGSDADALARACSLFMTRTRGGIKMLPWGSNDEEREARIFAMQPGEISPVWPIASGGFEVVVRESQIDAIRPEFEKVHDALKVVLAQRKRAAREREVSAAAWTKYHAALQLDDFAVDSVRTLLAEKPDTIVAKWDGGELKLREATSSKELDMIAKLTAKEAATQVEQRLRATVNAALFAKEARALKMDAVAEIATAVDANREKLMLNVLYGAHVLKDFKLSDEEIRAYYEEKKSTFVDPEKRRVAQILLASEADAKAAMAELARGKEFPDVAKERSRDITTASAGGDLGWVTADHVPPQFHEVFSMKPGTWTKPIRTSSGWHIIGLIAIAPKRQLSFEEVKQPASEGAEEKKKRAMRDDWLVKLREAAKIEIDDQAVKQFVDANPIDGVQAAPAMQHALEPAAH